MKAEELNALKEDTEAMNKTPAALTDDALRQVIGGHGESGILDRILSELSSWLDAHPNAAKSDVYDILSEKKMAYADELTVTELNALDELLDSFAS